MTYHLLSLLQAAEFLSSTFNFYLRTYIAREWFRVAGMLYVPHLPVFSFQVWTGWICREGNRTDDGADQINYPDLKCQPGGPCHSMAILLMISFCYVIKDTICLLLCLGWRTWSNWWHDSIRCDCSDLEQSTEFSNVDRWEGAYSSSPTITFSLKDLLTNNIIRNCYLCLWIQCYQVRLSTHNFTRIFNCVPKAYFLIRFLMICVQGALSSRSFLFFWDKTIFKEFSFLTFLLPINISAASIR